MFWKVLGIEATKDKKEITNAYRAKLMDTNPEDKPEEFKELREAYEAALKYAEFDESQLSLVDQMTEKLTAVYRDMKKRDSLDEWKAIIESEVFTDEATAEKAFEALIVFFLDNFRLPQKLMIYLNERFDIMDRIDELKEKYPAEFVDYILVGGISNEDMVPYGLFEPSLDWEKCEKCISLFRNARNAQSYEEAKPLLAEIRGLNEKNPVIEAFILSREIAYDNADKLDELKKLTEDHGHHNRISRHLVEALTHLNKNEEAVAEAERGLEFDGSDNRLRLLMADALAAEGKQSDAIDQLYDIMSNNGGEFARQTGERRQKWNEELIAKLTSSDINDLTNDEKVTLCWAYIQNGHNDLAAGVFETMDRSETEDFTYNNIVSVLSESEQKYDTAVEAIDNLIEIISNLKDDGTVKTARRMKRIPEMIARKSYIAFAKGEYEESLSLLDEAIAMDPADSTNIQQAARIAYFLKDYEKCVSYSDMMIRVNSRDYQGFFLKASSLFRMGRDRESFDCINRAIDLDPSELDSYILKLRLLIRNNAADPARELSKFLSDNGVNDYLELDFCNAMIKEYFDKDSEGAKAEYKRLAEKIEEGTQTEEPEQIFFRYLVTANSSLDANKKEECDVLLEIADRGLKISPEARNLLDYKAWLLTKAQRSDEALEIYLKLAEDPNHGPDTDYQIGYIYYDDLKNHADDSYKYFRAAYEKGDKDTLFYLSYLMFYMDRLDEAEKYCLEYRELMKEKEILDIDSFYRMSFIYEKRKDYEKALLENETAVENAKKRGKKDIHYYLNHQIRLLRMLNRGEDALKTLEENREQYDENYFHETRFKIAIQFGMWEKAEKVIDEWSKSKDKNVSKNCHVKRVELYSLMGDLAKAKSALKKHYWSMSMDDISEAETYIDSLTLDYKKLAKYYQKKIKNAKEKNLFDHIQLAVNYMEAGEKQKAREAGLVALELYKEEKNEKYSQYKALDHIFLSKIYICLEEFDKAREEIEMARKSTCAHCSYCSCKDADQYEAYLYIEKEEYDKAMWIINDSVSKWPDESCFEEYRKLIEKRLGKK